MKQPKKLTYRQKKLLSANGYDPDRYMFRKEENGKMYLWNKITRQNEWVEYVEIIEEQEEEDW